MIEYIRCDKCRTRSMSNTSWTKIKGIDGKKLHLCLNCYNEFLTWIRVDDVFTNY